MAFDQPQDSANPYQSPTTDAGSDFHPSGETAEILRQTRPWVLFLAILGTIATAFMAFGTVGMFIVAMAGGGPGPGRSQGLMLGMAIMYGVMTIAYIFLVMYLYQYSSRIQQFVLGGRPDQLDHALQAQKSFWKFLGIMAILLIVLYIIIMVFVIAGAMSGAFPQPQ
jgi:hypothetical protein